MTIHGSAERQDSSEKKSFDATTIHPVMAAENQVNGKQMSALKPSSDVDALLGKLHLTNESTKTGNNEKTAFSVEPCTPPGMDPKQDERNPISPNYNKELWGPHPARPKEPGSQILEPEMLPYGGRCGEDLVS